MRVCFAIRYSAWLSDKTLIILARRGALTVERLHFSNLNFYRMFQVLTDQEWHLHQKLYILNEW